MDELSIGKLVLMIIGVIPVLGGVAVVLYKAYQKQVGEVKATLENVIAQERNDHEREAANYEKRIATYKELLEKREAEMAELNEEMRRILLGNK
tara:strand:+ start:96 stop:377 length:282 start_codon:yes stop_codon:yes gene_type:complete